MSVAYGYFRKDNAKVLKNSWISLEVIMFSLYKSLSYSVKIKEAIINLSVPKTLETTENWIV